MDITLGIGVDGNRGEWVLKLNKSLYGLNQASVNWFVPHLSRSCLQSTSASAQDKSFRLDQILRLCCLEVVS